MVALVDVTMLSQREVERLFAAVVYNYPLYSVSECGWLSPAVILDQQVRQFWAGLQDNIHGTMDDDTALTTAMNTAVKAGIHLELSTWGRDLPSDAMPQAFAAEINRRAYLTNIAILTQDLSRAIGEQDDIAVREAVGKMAALIPAASATLPTADEVGTRFENLVDTGVRAVNTRIDNLDMATGGLERQTLTVLAARTSMGKSALGWQIARQVAAAGDLVIFFSLEMSASSLWARAACPAAGVTWRDVMAGKLDVSQRSRLKSRSGDLRKLYGDRLLIPDNRQTSESIWRYVAQLKPTLVVIDHLRFVADDTAENENKRQGKVTQALHDMSKALDIPVLLLAQINRSVERQTDKRPGLSDLRDSGEIEENADNVWMLYRGDYYNPPMVYSPFSDTELWVRKFRNGPQNICVKLVFNMTTELFEQRP